MSRIDTHASPRARTGSWLGARSSVSRLLALLALCALCACAASKPKVVSAPVVKPPEDPWSWLHEQDTTVARLALFELRKTAIWPIWIATQQELHVNSWVDLSKVSHLTFGGTGSKREDLSYVVALEGEFTATELRELALRDQVVPEQHGLLTIYRRPEGVWTQITPKLIVMVTPDRFDALIARASAGPGAKVKEAALFRSLGERVELTQTHLGVIAEDPDGSRRARLEKPASRVGLGPLARDSLRLGAGVQLGPEYRVVAISETADEATAAARQVELRDVLDGLSRNFLVRMLGLGGLLSKLHVSGEGPYVYVRGSLPEVEVESAITRVQGAIGLAAGFGQ